MFKKRLLNQSWGRLLLSLLLIKYKWGLSLRCRNALISNISTLVQSIWLNFLFYVFYWYHLHTIKFTFYSLHIIMYLLKVLNSVVFNISTESYNHQHYVILKHFHRPKKKPYIHGSHSHFPFLLPLATISLLSICMNFPLVYSGCFRTESNHMWPFKSGFFHLALISRFIHAVACLSTSFFFVAQWYSIVWM